MLTNAHLQELLRDADLVPANELTEAIEYAEHEQRPLSEILVERDLISDGHLGQVIADEAGLNFVDLIKLTIPEDTLRLVPENMARNLRVIAFDESDDILKVAMTDPSDLPTVHLLEKKSGKTVQVYLTTERAIKEAAGLYKKGLRHEFSSLIEEQVGAAIPGQAVSLSAIKILDTILLYAYQQKASDVHIEPTAENVKIRFRIDGVLHDMVNLPKHLHAQIIMRIKILGKLRTDEHRAAQDGKLVQHLDEEDLDVRISIIPVSEGEKAVMRLLSSRSRQFALENLGFNEKDIESVRHAIKQPHGMILVTGPTGCGKTTTLYALLKILNRREVNISTIEDPVEYAIEGINQIQVNEATNLLFSTGLRSIVRQDPDIIMIGEIRDEETAGIAVNSAMTGHLVLSTLHTNDAATTLPRLLDMNVEPFLVASTVQIAIGQRLVRQICTRCLESYVVNGDEFENLKSEIDVERYFGKKATELRFYKGKGCASCDNTGYRGRIGVFEVLKISKDIRKLIVDQADSETIRQLAIKEGMTTMFEDGLQKALVGLTTLDEVFRVLSE